MRKGAKSANVRKVGKVVISVDFWGFFEIIGEKFVISVCLLGKSFENVRIYVDC